MSQEVFTTKSILHALSLDHIVQYDPLLEQWENSPLYHECDQMLSETYSKYKGIIEKQLKNTNLGILDMSVSVKAELPGRCFEILHELALFPEANKVQKCASHLFFFHSKIRNIALATHLKNFPLANGLTLSRLYDNLIGKISLGLSLEPLKIIADALEQGQKVSDSKTQPLLRYLKFIGRIDPELSKKLTALIPPEPSLLGIQTYQDVNIALKELKEAIQKHDFDEILLYGFETKLLDHKAFVDRALKISPDNSFKKELEESLATLEKEHKSCQELFKAQSLKTKTEKAPPRKEADTRSPPGGAPIPKPK